MDARSDSSLIAEFKRELQAFADVSMKAEQAGRANILTAIAALHDETRTTHRAMNRRIKRIEERVAAVERKLKIVNG